jgi:HD-GYP domain-containing protein (c-di-GMP phosphodiesterase class II)
METRDRLAPGHSRNVADLALLMAEKLGLSDTEQHRIHSAGLLHDIGKIALPDQLLKHTATKLTGAQLQTYQSHAICGQAAIDMVPALREIGVLIRHHHEYYNGNGFPDRLVAEKIPLGSRLICAADMFERTFIKYPEPDSLQQTFAELAKHWGRMLDPGLRTILEKSALEIYGQIKEASNFFETRVGSEELKAGMVLCEDLCSGTGVLMLKRGTVFDEAGIKAVKRCQVIDPFEKEILVSIEKNSSIAEAEG